MTADLRPMSLGEILDRTFLVYRRHLRTHIMVALFPALAVLAFHLVNYLVIHLETRGTVAWSLSPVLGKFFARLILYHLSALVWTPFIFAFAWLVAAQESDQQPTSREALQLLRARWRDAVWVAVLKIAVVLFVPEIITAGILVSLAYLFDKVGVFAPGSGIFPGLFAGIIPAVIGLSLFFWLGPCFALALPAAALEGYRGRQALVRSWRLSHGGRLRIFVVWSMIVLFGWGISISGQLGFRWIMYFSSWKIIPSLVWLRVYSIGSYLLMTMFSTVLGPLYPIALTLIYYDQRIRREGYDVERMIEGAGLNIPATSPVQVAPEVESPRLEEPLA